MTQPILGIHHVTAIVGDAQRNLDFYTRVLGLRLVKVTINYDDPGTYHLYFADQSGRPGTVITFFPWPDAPRGTPGRGQVVATTYSVPLGALEYWQQRLAQYDIACQPRSRMGESLLQLHDPDDLALELIATEHPMDAQPWGGSDVPPEHAIRGFHSVTISSGNPHASRELLLQTMGFREVASEQGWLRFETGEGGPSTIVDIIDEPDREAGSFGPGTVHHVAFRAADEQSQLQWRERLVDAGCRVTPVRDRTYFQSIYFREPGGVIVEIATDGPGFTVDEPAEALGSSLVLPAWAHQQRAEIERKLPALTLAQS